MEFTIIDDVNTVITNLLKKECGDPLPFNLSFAMPDKNFSPPDGNKITANFYLYDIDENVELRSNEPIIEKYADGTTSSKQPPMRIKLAYLITTWSPVAKPGWEGDSVRDEHILMSEILLALVKYHKIPDEFLANNLIGQEPPMKVRVFSPNGYKNPAEFWSSFEGRPVRPALEYNITFSLDYHKAISGKMVLAKLSEYGSMTRVFRLTIRPPIRSETPSDHSKDTPLAKMKIEAAPTVNLDAAANQGDTTLTVTDSSGLSVNDVLIIVDGKKTEFSQIEEIHSANEIKVTKDLLFDHNDGTELKLLSVAPNNFEVKLASVASAKINILRVTGPDVQKLNIGDVIKINNPNKIEFCQITEISGPETGLNSGTDSFVQIGGLVTNMAGAPITGADVSVLDSNSVLVNKKISDAEGRFNFVNLNKGEYRFNIEAQGYSPMVRIIADITSAQFYDLIFKLASI